MLMEPFKHAEVKVTVLPNCDLCLMSLNVERTAAYDGATKGGPWAYMCEAHFKSNGVGLGIGRGQRLVVEGR